MTYNIFEGGHGRIDPIAEVIRLARADVVVVQEATDERLFHQLADRLGMDRFLAANPRNHEGAVGLLARWRIREAVNQAALNPHLTRGCLTAVVQGEDGERLALVGLHLHARERAADEQVRLSELPAVLAIAGGLADKHVIAGDFNTNHPDQPIAWDDLRDKVKERVIEQRERWQAGHPREVVRRILEAGYVDAHAVRTEAGQFGKSFPTQRPATRVDFIFVSPALAGKDGGGSVVRSCEVFTTEMGRYCSDHYPVVAELSL